MDYTVISKNFWMLAMGVVAILALMELCRRHGLEPKRLRLVQNTAQSAPWLLLLECRRGGKTGLTVDAPLIMTNEDGTATADVDAAYFRDKR